MFAERISKFGSGFVQDWFGPEHIIILVQDRFGRCTVPARIVYVYNYKLGLWWVSGQTQSQRLKDSKFTETKSPDTQSPLRVLKM